MTPRHLRVLAEDMDAEDVVSLRRRIVHALDAVAHDAVAFDAEPRADDDRWVMQGLQWHLSMPLAPDRARSRLHATGSGSRDLSVREHPSTGTPMPAGPAEAVAAMRSRLLALLDAVLVDVPVPCTTRTETVRLLETVGGDVLQKTVEGISLSESKPLREALDWTHRGVVELVTGAPYGRPSIVRTVDGERTPMLSDAGTATLAALLPPVAALSSGSPGHWTFRPLTVPLARRDDPVELMRGERRMATALTDVAAATDGGNA